VSALPFPQRESSELHMLAELLEGQKRIERLLLAERVEHYRLMNKSDAAEAFGLTRDAVTKLPIFFTIEGRAGEVTNWASFIKYLNERA
jgi:hypothetical protein